ncbi:hypothetical protein AMS68_000997 [Peltaster fructicola]|uniref:Uncharacterized protein n=1 Tax=Peltaster fructicola TaxID=286661 RepID=A0A6H0XLV1_9PEZI|nr:hypothetical protein AMS68_000997 [Peltaster fructicola]
MGGQNSVPVINARIDAVLPHMWLELADSSTLREKLQKHATSVFPGGYSDRTQFVDSLRLLLSSNGQTPLGDKRFKLVWSRATKDAAVDDGTENAQMYVSVVASGPDGVLAAKVASERPGKDKVEAFKIFKMTVETKMHEMLDGIPNSGAAAASGSAHVVDAERNRSAASLASTVFPDEPPSYEEASK